VVLSIDSLFSFSGQFIFFYRSVGFFVFFFSSVHFFFCSVGSFQVRSVSFFVRWVLWFIFQGPGFSRLVLCFLFQVSSVSFSVRLVLCFLYQVNTVSFSVRLVFCFLFKGQWFSGLVRCFLFQVSASQDWFFGFFFRSVLLRVGSLVSFSGQFNVFFRAVGSFFVWMFFLFYFLGQWFSGVVLCFLFQVSSFSFIVRSVLCFLLLFVLLFLSFTFLFLRNFKVGTPSLLCQRLHSLLSVGSSTLSSSVSIVNLFF